MSAYLIGLQISSAGLLAYAIAKALRSYEKAADRVTEGHRARILTFHPHGTHQSGYMADEPKRKTPNR